MKRVISMALVAAMLLSLMSGTVFAANADALVIHGNNVAVEPGQTATVTLKVEQNPGFMGICFYPVIADANGKTVSWSWKGSKSNSDFAIDMNVGSLILFTADANVYGTGTLMDVTFTVPSDVAPGVYTVAFQLYQGECFNDEGDDVPVELPTVTITVGGCVHKTIKTVGASSPTCTQNGYTGDIVCADCGETLQSGAVIIATGHSYANGNCTVCGDPDPDYHPVVETITVYFRNDWKWSSVNAYYWGSANSSVGWPGVAITKVGTALYGNEERDVYAAEIPADATGLIFNGYNPNDKTNQQTPDIADFADGDAYYIYWDNGNKVGKFVYPPVDVPTPDTLMITGNDVTVKPGEAATITLTMEQNPGFMGISFYPVITDANGKTITWKWTAKKASAGSDFDLNAATIILLTADENVYGTGDLLTVTFTLPETVQSGDYTVAFVLYDGECFNDDLDEVPVVLPTVTVTVAACMHYNTVNVDGKAPTCTADGCTASMYCQDCGACLIAPDVIPALGHEDRTNDHICDNGCGNVVTECSDKTGDGNHDCDICGKPNVSGHTYGDASCDAPATCTECGVTTGAALGHSFTKYRANNDATCMEDGTETAKCNRCDATHTRTIPGSTVGHKDDNKDCWCDYGCGTEIPIGADTLVISANNAILQPGETATIALTIVQNPGVQGMLFWPVITAPDGAKVNWTWKASNKKSDIEFDLNAVKTIVLSADGNLYDTGLLLEITFTVPAEQTLGQYTVSFTVDPDDGCLDENLDTVPCVMPTVTITVCADRDTDHYCDDCGAWMGEHSDSNMDHNCDYGCAEKIGEHKDTAGDGDHVCDYCRSAEVLTECADADKDHDCDECGEWMGEHGDKDKDHNCDYGCTETIGEHSDENKDHNCDYGCKELIGTCEDKDLDHACDYGCAKYYGVHEDENKDHNCDYGCKELIGTCEDKDLDHACDYGCAKYYGVHEDKDLDHNCDYGCKELIGTCEDADKDHACDYGCSKYYGKHIDADKDHNCDYGCKELIGTCEDLNKDHKCDYGCAKYYGVHEDKNKDHNCDYGCAETIGEHADAANDGDHVCDYGCGAVLEDCSDVTGDGNHNCDVCGKADVTEHNFKPADCLNLATCKECALTQGELGPHNYDSVINIAPEATRTGVLNGKCIVCEQKVVVTLPKLNTTDYSYEVIKEPTMYADGIGRYTWNDTTYGCFSFDAVIHHEIPETDAQIVIESTSAMAGNTIRLEMTLKNNPGIAGILAYLKYDTAVLTLVKVENGTIFPTLDYAKALVWTADENCMDDGLLCVLEFQIAEDAPAGTYPIQLIFEEVLNDEFDEVPLHAAYATVTVFNVIYGDANGDGKITLKDALLLRQYFANKDPDTGESSIELEPGADANGDGKITLKDALLLRQYFANKDPDTGESSIVLGPQ